MKDSVQPVLKILCKFCYDTLLPYWCSSFEPSMKYNVGQTSLASDVGESSLDIEGPAAIC